MNWFKFSILKLFLASDKGVKNRRVNSMRPDRHKDTVFLAFKRFEGAQTWGEGDGWPESVILLKCFKLGTKERKQHELQHVFRDPGLASRGQCGWTTYSVTPSYSHAQVLVPITMSLSCLHARFFQAIRLSSSPTLSFATAITIHSFGSPKQILWLQNMLRN